MTNPPEDHIRYDMMVQDALIGVVRHVLVEASKNGLPGEHHFYISFRTHAPGVRISNRLLEKHPDEMTIVLQHQYWDLLVSESSLEVGLSFGGVPEKLHIPFDAMTGFFDPSVQFGLKFAVEETIADNDADNESDADVRARLEAIVDHEKATKPGKANATAKLPRGKKKTAEKSSEHESQPEPDASETPATDSPKASAQVVSLEAFRKKK